MSRHHVVVIALFFASVIPARAAEEVPSVDVVSSEGIAAAYGSGAVLDVPGTGRNFLTFVGGLTQSGAFNPDAHLYDPDAGLWSETPVLGDGYQPRAFGASAAVGSNLFLLGGQNADGFPEFDKINVISLGESSGSILVQYSDLQTSGDIPSPRDLFQAVYHLDTGMIYGFGGRTPDGKLSDEAFSLDPESGEFKKLRDLPRPLAEHVVTALGGKILLAYGLTYAQPGDQVVVNDRFIAYDVADNTFEEMSPGGDMPDPVYLFGAAPIVRDRMWFFGGIRADQSLSDRTYTYDAVENRLERGPVLPFPLAGMVVGVVPSSETDGDHVEVLIHGGDLGGTVSTATLKLTSAENVPPDYGVAAMADIQGVGAVFTSQSWIHNAGELDLSLAARFKPRQGTGSADLTSSFTVGPGAMVYADNALSDLFGSVDDRVGAIGFRVKLGPSVDLIGQTTITAEDDQGRRYGQSFPFSRPRPPLRYQLGFRAGGGAAGGQAAQTAPERHQDRAARVAAPLREAAGSGETAYLFTTEDPASNRVNVGGMAVGRTAVVVTPELPVGSPLAQGVRVELEDGESFQVNNVYDTFGLGPAHANAVISLAVEAGILIPYGSVLDGNGAYAGTNDPTTIRPVAGPGSKEVWLLELGSISGQGGSRYKGSASILNFGTQTATVQAEFFRRGSPGVSASATLSVPPGGVLGFSDFASEALGVVGDVGTVRFTTDGDGIAATGREYSVEADGAGTVTGTAGQLMRGLTEDDLLEPGLVCHGLGLREGGGERSHATFFNPGTSAATVEVSLYNGADGAFEGSRSFTVPGEQLEQFNNIIPLVNPGHDGSEKRIEVTVTQPVYGAIFRVNPWNDPVTFDLHCR